MVKDRYLSAAITTLCQTSHKMAFISGPRQCGKTTLAKKMLRQRGYGQYFNWDEKHFRKSWAKAPLSLLKPFVTSPAHAIPLIIFDEIHKAKLWKRDLKGIYDTTEEPVDIIVTGSAKLDVYRRGSDSLLGRYFHFRLHPFSLGELLKNQYTLTVDSLLATLFSLDTRTIPTNWRKKFDLLWAFGPFPEPLFSENKKILRLWQRNRVERLVREDLRDLSRIQELSQVEILVSLLPERAAGVLSINALREDLEVAYATMKLWINYLKQIYYIHEIKPYFKAIPRALKKEGKLYLWDWSEVENDGARFENLIANHLLKYIHFLTDSGEATVELHYLKNKQKQEIDFLIVKDKIPWLPIEVKLSDTMPSKNWETFFKVLPCKQGLQIIKKPGICKLVALTHGEVLILSAEYFLAFLA